MKHLVRTREVRSVAHFSASDNAVRGCLEVRKRLDQARNIGDNECVDLNHETCYQALKTHDARFDGAFFVGVTSTGIYCRTVCPVKPPKPQNCTFHQSAAAAEHAGFRPCLRCRPELAPGKAHVDAVGKLASTAYARIEDGLLDEISVDELASELGVTGRHLRRAVEREYGVSPVQLAQTQRLLTAKRLLTDTDLAIGDIAFASGFSSLRRFNALFQERYRLKPGDLRRGKSRGQGETIVCETAYRDPYDWDFMLRFLGKRAIKGVELVSGAKYMRTVSLGEHRGFIEVSQLAEKRLLRIEMSSSLAPVLPKILLRIKRLFDTAADPEPIVERLGALAENSPGLPVPGAFDGFEMSVRAILGQQVSVAGATTIAGRLVERFGSPIVTPHVGLSHTFPSALTIAQASPDEISILGMPRARGLTISSLAKAVAHDGLRLAPGRSIEKTLEDLVALPGIGEWTAQYIAMRALGWPDAFPHSDLGVRKALGLTKDRDVLSVADGWRPWRAYATFHLWHSLEQNP